MLPLVPGTSLAIAKLMLLSVRPCLTAPSENTVKFTTGAPATVTAGTPLSCRTLNADDELVEVSFAGLVAADAIACDSAVPVLSRAGGGAGVARPPPSLPPPHPDSAIGTRATATHHAIERFMDNSLTSSVPPGAAFAIRPCA